jgi:uncharacterized membrane protein
MWPHRASFACVAVLIAALTSCKKPDAVVCDPPVNPTCPGTAPSFASDVYPNVFVPFCVSCHSSTGVESKTPLTSYQQIYVQAGAIITQVFENCAMPPSNEPQLTDDADGGDAAALGARQTLLDWLVCGAPNN